MKLENAGYFFTKNAINIRVREQLTQRDMAVKLGITRNILGAIEEGRIIGIVNLYAYSLYSGYTMNDLITKHI